MDRIAVPTQQAPLPNQHFSQQLDNVDIGVDRREGHRLHRQRRVVEHHTWEFPPPPTQPIDETYFVTLSQSFGNFT